jgi:glycosyltransferase involved in cell wall biosynthesis
MKSPFFSIIIPTYNRAFFIGKAIESVVCQLNNKWELIVVDDGSTDNTKEIVLSFNDDRIRYIYQENQERSAARNNGVNIAHGKWICFLDSDDQFLSNHLEVFSQKIKENKDIHFFYNLKVGELECKKEDKYNQVFASVIHCQQVCIRKKLLIENKFNTDLYIGEDLELWMRILEHTDIICTDVKSVKIIDHENRTVGIKRLEPLQKHLELITEITRIYKSKIKVQYRRKSISDAYFNIAKYFIGKDFLNAISYTIKSLLYNMKSEQSKHRFLVLLSLLKIYPKKVLEPYIQKVHT